LAQKTAKLTEVYMVSDFVAFVPLQISQICKNDETRPLGGLFYRSDSACAEKFKKDLRRLPAAWL
jgi:hypothetical protein